MKIMGIRAVMRVGCFKLTSRRYSTSNKLVTVSKNEVAGTSIISMNRAPVNGLNIELLGDLKESLENVQKDGSKGVILTSSLPTVFCGGLDMMEMYKSNVERVTKLWTAVQDTWMTLYSLGLPTVAAVNGASPAGGCLFAISCEYRIFVDGKHGMGLNETKLGLIVPRWIDDVYASTIGYRRAELALLRGDQFTPKEALEIGLVDELATSKEDVLEKAEKYISNFAKISPAARAETKKVLRRSLIEEFETYRKQDTATFVETIMQPKVQAVLEQYINSLKKKK